LYNRDIPTNSGSAIIENNTMTIIGKDTTELGNTPVLEGSIEVSNTPVVEGSIEVSNTPVVNLQLNMVQISLEQKATLKDIIYNSVYNDTDGMAFFLQVTRFIDFSNINMGTSEQSRI
jgi:hypothetical protein